MVTESKKSSTFMWYYMGRNITFNNKLPSQAQIFSKS